MESKFYFTLLEIVDASLILVAPCSRLTFWKLSIVDF